MGHIAHVRRTSHYIVCITFPFCSPILASEFDLIIFYLYPPSLTCGPLLLPMHFCQVCPTGSIDEDDNIKSIRYIQ